MKGQHAVVTGGGRGIGATIVTALESAGARVTVMGRTAGIRCDVSNPEDVARAFAEAVEHSGPVNVLVNNAGQADAGAFESIPLETWNQLLAVNLTGTFLCSQQVVPAMIAARAGRIVNVASTAGLIGYARTVAYCAAKHGVIGLTRALAAETARSGMTVNAVCPGYTDGTEMFASAVGNVMRTKRIAEEEARAMLARLSPRGTLTTPEEVAATVAWLCSPAAAAITGQAIPVAGGEVMR